MPSLGVNWPDFCKVVRANPLLAFFCWGKPQWFEDHISLAGSSDLDDPVMLKPQASVQPSLRHLLGKRNWCTSFQRSFHCNSSGKTRTSKKRSCSSKRSRAISASSWSSSSEQALVVVLLPAPILPFIQAIPSAQGDLSLTSPQKEDPSIKERHLFFYFSCSSGHESRPFCVPSFLLVPPSTFLGSHVGKEKIGRVVPRWSQFGPAEVEGWDSFYVGHGRCGGVAGVL